MLELMKLRYKHQYNHHLIHDATVVVRDVGLIQWVILSTYFNTICIPYIFILSKHTDYYHEVVN